MLRDVTCWNCGGPADRRRVEVELVLHGRARAEGGPYRVWRCPRCRADNGVLAGPCGGTLLYPLSGLRAATVLDRFLSAAERLRLTRSQAWWLVHRDDVDAFRRGESPRAGTGSVRDTATTTADPSGGCGTRPTDTPRPAAARSPTPDPAVSVSGPRAVLGVPPSAPRDEIRRAFRRLAKRHHPDRAGASQDAAARFREIRAAYEDLMRETEDPGGALG